MLYKNMFDYLNEIFIKPEAYSCYTAEAIWNDSYISSKMLELHLSKDEAAASRPKDFLERSIKWMINRFNINSNTKLCDFGCGPGLYTTPLAKAGAQVTGIDFSERSINYARETATQENLYIEYINDNYLNYNEAKKFDLITMIYCDFTALSDKQRQQLLSIFHNICADDGYILLDVYSLKHYENKVETSLITQTSNENIWSNFWSPEPYYAITNIYKYDDKHLCLDKYVIFEKIEQEKYITG